MPTIQFECDNKHITEKFFKSIKTPSEIPCEHKKCQEISTKTIIGGTANNKSASPASTFQKYAFGQHNYATHEDRRAWLNKLDQDSW